MKRNNSLFSLDNIIMLICGFVLSTLLFMLFKGPFLFFLIIVLLIIFYILMIKRDSIIGKRTLPITPIAIYGSYNIKYVKQIMKGVVSILIDLEYYNINVLERIFSQNNAWTILASKVEAYSKKKKLIRDHSSNINPIIKLKKGKFSVMFTKIGGQFVRGESKILYDRLITISHLKLKPGPVI